jgi:GTP-dependent phosphoenolpyruvate carboxykinase
MKSPEKVPVRRQLLRGGSKVTIHSLNNKTKRYIHVPQCAYGDCAHTALRNYKVVEQVVKTVGGGVKSPEGLDVGALWFGKRLAETNHDEFTACSSRAGIAITAQMSLMMRCAAFAKSSTGYSGKNVVWTVFRLPLNR